MSRESTFRSASHVPSKAACVLLALVVGILYLTTAPLSRAAEEPAAFSRAAQDAVEAVPMQEPPVEALGEPGEDLQGPPPHPCVITAFDISRTCAVELHDAAAACIETIAQLFENGQADEVPPLVEACIEGINQQAGDCMGVLRDHCDECITTLIEEDAPIELIEAVARACHEAGGHILHARKDAVDAIKDAVDHGIARACVKAMRRLTTACAEQNAQTAQACVEQIEALIEQGLMEEAIEAARNCRREIRLQTAQCGRELIGRCHDCLDQLMRRCADEGLIHRMRNVCEQSLRRLHQSAKRAILQIGDALPPPPPDEMEADGLELSSADAL